MFKVVKMSIIKAIKTVPVSVNRTMCWTVTGLHFFFCKGAKCCNR